MFEKFYQADNRSNVGGLGLGLGLAIASRIIALHQGRITMVSNPADHTTFTVYLPSKGSAK
ncbi:ATP-binding protein [Limosilactobacillus fermentum]